MKCTSPYHLKGIFPVPCGNCMACRISRTAEWSTRIEHEMKGKDSCFITLTYNKDYADEKSSLVKTDLVKFFKRLRKAIDTPIKYYACGEYGDIGNRPHYHAIIIGWKPDDVYGYLRTGKEILRQSKLVEKLWKYGYSSVGTATPDSIQYVTGYVRKKINGKKQFETYGYREPPFALQSLGIGKEYALENINHFFKGYITKNGKKIPIPRYYKKLLGENVIGYEEINKIIGEGYKLNELKEYIGQDNESLEEYLVNSDSYHTLKESDRMRRRSNAEALENRVKKGTL